MTALSGSAWPPGVASACLLGLVLGCGRIGYDPSADAGAPAPDGSASTDGAVAPDGAVPGTDGGPPVPRCGDGTVDPLEVCDDANANPGDGCSPSCTLEDQGPGGGACGSVLAVAFVPTADGTFSAFATGSTSGASDTRTASCATATGDRIFELTLSVDSDLAVYGLGINGNPVLHLHSGTCDTGPEIQCIDDTGSQQAEQLVVEGLTAGTYYLFFDAGPGGAEVDFEVELVQIPRSTSGGTS